LIQGNLVHFTAVWAFDGVIFLPGFNCLGDSLGNIFPAQGKRVTAVRTGDIHKIFSWLVSLLTDLNHPFDRNRSAAGETNSTS